jgi:hypothetical protein
VHPDLFGYGKRFVIILLNSFLIWVDQQQLMEHHFMVDWLISRFEGPSSPGLYYLLHYIYIYIYICFTFCYISTLKSTRIIGHSATAFLRACNFCVFRSWLLENMLSENFALFLSLGSTGMINQQIFETVRALQNFLIILNVINCFHGFFRFQHFRV